MTTKLQLRSSNMITCKNCFNRECEGRENMIVCDIDGESHEPDYTCENAEPEEQ